MLDEKTFTLELLIVAYKFFCTMTDKTVFYWWFITNCISNVFLSYTAIALNSVTIYAIRKISSPPKPLKILLLSLAVGDLGVGLFVEPLHIVRFIMELQPNPQENNPTYQIIFFVNLVLVNLLSYASFFGVTDLTVDRFLAIHLHLKYQELLMS